ncbi:hypothetical protein [Alienimonas californiensis]|uniref:Uncharacterized protein n=1 Tax=Alienimonas californiensis TaxID=2527989 RepID=A0A517PA65_9PLAN|nr:hypothetical protein [Alienimonas californiensis]QDT16258.1 hypothetical protein CA12_23590 [Alienimonas californiensis]
MTAPAALLLAALAMGPGAAGPGAAPAELIAPPELAPVLPATLTGFRAAPPAPLVVPLALPPAGSGSVIRGQSPSGWGAATPAGPAYGVGPGYGGVPEYGGGPAYGAPVGPPPSFGPTMPVGPEFAPPQFQETYGVNGPQPYDFAPEFRFDAGYLFPADAEGRGDRLAVTEVDAQYEADSPGPFGTVFTIAPNYRLRLLDGPSADVAAGQPRLPGALHRLGSDFSLMTPKYGRFSATVGFAPSTNTDFEDGLTELGRQYDGRAALFYDVAPDLTLVAGAKYYDRVDDLLLPWAGFVWRPGDRWEIRAVFPEPRVEYFYGPVLGKPMWLYAEGQFRRESWQFSPDVPGGPEIDEVQFDDLRLLVGARKEQGWGRTFLEAGVVFNREVSFKKQPDQNFDVGEALIFRGGVRF